MKYTIENNGSGFLSFRVLVPERQAAAFFAFIEQKSKENPPVVKSVSSGKNEAYFTELSLKCLTLFDTFVSDGMTAKAAISAVNQNIKVLGFANTSYDIVKSLLTKQGCFKRI